MQYLFKKKTLKTNEGQRWRWNSKFFEDLSKYDKYFNAFFNRMVIFLDDVYMMWFLHLFAAKDSYLFVSKDTSHLIKSIIISFTSM